MIDIGIVYGISAFGLSDDPRDSATRRSSTAEAKS